jgi:hypothetical protein
MYRHGEHTKQAIALRWRVSELRQEAQTLLRALKYDPA